MGTGCKKAIFKDGSLLCDGAHLIFGEPLKGHTSLGIGGPATVFARPADVSSLKEVLHYVLDEGLQFYYIGGGTNLLVTDEPLEAVVISTGMFKGIELLKKESGEFTLKAHSGESLKGLLSYCQKSGLSGLEELAGIPGSVGGAVKGNSGSYGTEIKDVLVRAQVLSKEGELKVLSNRKMNFEYRGSGLAESDLVIWAEFRLKEDDPGRVKFKMNEYFALKRKTQPIEARSAGCVFKNPPDNFAGKLIEEAGMKGKRVGDIEVSGLHANFFVNKGKGTAKEFTGLMDKVAEEVNKRTGITLMPEIRMIRNAVHN